jgi:hypothetical protein
MTTRRNGRPPLDADSPSVPLTVRVPSATYDQLCVRAQHERTTVSELVRRSSHLLSYTKLDTDEHDG